MNHTDKIKIDTKDLNDREKKVLGAIKTKGPLSVEDLRKECFPGIRADEDTHYAKSTAAGNRAVRNALRRLIAGQLVQKTWLTREGSKQKLTAFLPAQS